MALGSRRNIPVPDFRDVTDVSIGVTLPFNGEGVFNRSFTSKAQIKTNLLSVLLTEPGERIMQPTFGVGLRKHLFENNIKKDEIEERINKQVQLYVPQISIKNLKIKKGINSHTISIKMTYRIRRNNSFDAIQINFRGDSNQGGGAVGSSGY